MSIYPTDVHYIELSTFLPHKKVAKTQLLELYTLKIRIKCMIVLKIWAKNAVFLVLCAAPAYGTQSEADSVTKELGCGTTVCFAAKPRKYQNLKNLFFDKL